MTTRTVPELLPLIRDRRSIRTFDPDHVLADEELATMLDAARWAASAGNSQPWAFVVGRRGDPTHRRIVARLSRGNTSWAPYASALVVTLHQAATGPEEDALTYSDYAMYDLGQAVAQLGLQAASLGLVAHQFAGFDHEALAADLGVPRHWRVTTTVAVGRQLAPDRHADPILRERDQRPPTRRPLAEIAFGGRFGEPLDLGSAGSRSER